MGHRMGRPRRTSGRFCERIFATTTLGQENPLQADPNEHATIGPDHQRPSPTAKKTHQRLMRIGVWFLLLLTFGVGLFLVLRHHDDTKKRTTSSRPGAAGGTATGTSATAQKRDIGVELDAIAT